MREQQRSQNYKYDVFISHASEDKEIFVAPLAQLLSNIGVILWYDEFTLNVGDSLSSSIDYGLANSRYGIVVLSKAFLKKPWPEYELRGLISIEMSIDDKIILPIWYGIAKDEVLRWSPSIADKIAIDASKKQVNEVALDLLKVIRPDIFNNLIRWLYWRRKVQNTQEVVAEINEIHPGPIRHEKLPKKLINRLTIIHANFQEYLNISLEDFIDAFRRDLHPAEEITRWEWILANYLQHTQGRESSSEEGKSIFSDWLLRSLMNNHDEN